MSRYTSQIRYICESLSGLTSSVGYKSIDEVIEKSRNLIFPHFEIFDESYRGVLETKILKHFYTREIGFETFGLWQLKLDAKLSIIMPYYNKIYKALLIDIPIVENVDTKRTHDRNSKDESNTKTNGTSESTSNTNTHDKNRYSDTPQGSLTDLENDNYLTSATISDGTNTTTGTVQQNSTTQIGSNTTENYVERITGKEGSQTYISMINEYIEKLKNVDLMVINELEELFMQVWDIGE